MENYNPLKEYAIEELKKRNLIEDAWDAVDLFEKTIARYAGSKYAVTVDNCTDALFLCLKYLECDLKDEVVTIPKNTYCSVPMTIYNSGCQYRFEDLEWSGTYQLKPYPIYDSALRLTKDMYIKNSFQCLSFHRKKILKLTKGGVILTDSEEATEWFKTMRCKGRHPHKKIFYVDEKIDMMGWNMYMHPEDAAKAFLILEKLPIHNKDKGGSESYEDLTKHKIFIEKQAQ
jgi:dTDP-4-amino-4,6-dideoxygalactose transaminase